MLDIDLMELSRLSQNVQDVEKNMTNNLATTVKKKGKI